MQQYDAFILDLKRKLSSTLRESREELSDISLKAGISKERLISLTQGKANLRINDLLNIARACSMRAEFKLFDTLSGYEYGKDEIKALIYSDYSDEMMTLRRRELLRSIIRAEDKAVRGQLSHELESLSKIDCNSSRLRYFIFLKVEDAMHSLCLSKAEVADMMNVSLSYIDLLSDGEANFSIEFLYRLAKNLYSTWEIRFVPWKEGLEDQSDNKRA